MTDHYVARLVAEGMSPDAARAKGPLFAAAAQALRARGVEAAQPLALFVPGRVEVLGKHTDYAGGRSLLCAVERGVCLLAVPRADRKVRVVDARVDEEVVFEFDAAIEPPMGHWSNYPMTVARRLARNFPEARRGADIAFTSDLPLGAGVSSSSALVVAIFLALSALNDLEDAAAYRREITSMEALASYVGCVENGESFGTLAGDRGVGVFGGSEDQTAILCCRPHTLSQYAFCPVRSEGTVPFPAGHTLVIANSGVLAEKAGGAREAYNRASVATRVIVRRWNAATGRADGALGDAVVSGTGAPDRIRGAIRDGGDDEYPVGVLLDRFEQFLDESTRIIPAAYAALARSDLARFGVLVDESQAGVERWLGNQIAETIALQRQARELGAAAASAFGAGFGGSVWALVARSDAEAFAHHWLTRYRAAFPNAGAAAHAFDTGAGPAALRLADLQP
ncbi:MAG TPA: galactokinase family protein [Gemmatimonadaceae bacterium]|nr:galactokinase family protein [Gemmatimonadaceae bacterium]